MMAGIYSPAIAQKEVRQIDNKAFSFGEKITYKVRYNLYFNLNVGEIEFEIKPDAEEISKNKCYHISGIGKTYSFYDNFFKVRDKYEAFVETQSLLPLVSTREVKEGNYKFNEMVVYNQKKSKVKTSKHVKDVPKHTMDVITAIYYSRTLNVADAKVGDKFMMHTFIDDSAYYVGVKYAGKEIIKTDAGKFRCIKLVPILIKDRVFKSEEGMTLWVTDDENHLPVRVESGISVGAIRADIVKYSGVKNAVSSKVK